MKFPRTARLSALTCMLVGATLFGLADTAAAGTYKSLQSSFYFTGPPGIKHAQGITTSFAVPKYSCASGETSGVSAGATVWDGTHASSKAAGTVYFNLLCSKGKVSHATKLNINGKWTTPSFAVKAGDELALSIVQSSSKTSLTLSDLSTHKSTSRSGPGASSPNYAAIGMNAVYAAGTSKYEPIPHFGHVTFSGSTVNGVKLGKWGLSKFLMYGGTKSPPPASAHLLVNVSTLTKSSSFTCTFMHAS